MKDTILLLVLGFCFLWIGNKPSHTPAEIEYSPYAILVDNTYVYNQETPSKKRKHNVGR